MGEFCWRCCRLCEILQRERFCKVQTSMPDDWTEDDPAWIEACRREECAGPPLECCEESHICGNIDIRTRKTVSP